MRGSGNRFGDGWGKEERRIKNTSTAHAVLVKLIAVCY
jgi:hypothetical protein